jgi:hypothetical protein
MLQACSRRPGGILVEQFIGAICSQIMKLFMEEVQLALHPACGDTSFYTSPHAKPAALHTETSKTIVVDDTSKRVSSLDTDRLGVALESVTFFLKSRMLVD